MPRNSDLTLENIRHEVEVELGGSAIAVELDEQDFVKCTKDAVRHYSRACPQRHTKAVTISRATKRYQLASADHPGLLGVVQVSFVSPDSLAGDFDPFLPENRVTAGLSTLGGETFGELAYRRAYAEDASRVISSEPEWHAQWEEDGEHYLYIDVSLDGVYCSYTWTSYYTPDEHSVTGMQWIPVGDVQWILDFTAARARQVLARVRGKFQGVPTPDGGQDPLDYDAMASEGRERETELLEELQKRRRPLPPVIG